MVKRMMIPRLATGLGIFHETITIILERFTATASPLASGSTQQITVQGRGGGGRERACGGGWGGGEEKEGSRSKAENLIIQ